MMMLEANNAYRKRTPPKVIPSIPDGGSLRSPMKPGVSTRTSTTGGPSSDSRNDLASVVPSRSVLGPESSRASDMT